MGGGIGDFVNDVVGTVTGGLIGESPQEKAAKEAEKRRKEAEAQQKKAEEQQKREQELLKKQEQDIQEANKAATEEVARGKPTTTVDFSQAIKGEDEENEDELLKMFRGAK